MEVTQMELFQIFFYSKVWVKKGQSDFFNFDKSHVFRI